MLTRNSALLGLLFAPNAYAWDIKGPAIFDDVQSKAFVAAKGLCEGHDYNAEQCAAVGAGACCVYSSVTDDTTGSVTSDGCFSKVGDGFCENGEEAAAPAPEEEKGWFSWWEVLFLPICLGPVSGAFGEGGACGAGGALATMAGGPPPEEDSDDPEAQTIIINNVYQNDYGGGDYGGDYGGDDY
jgi:hypothetical protein